MDPTVEAQRLALEKLVASMDKAFRSFRLYEARGPQYEAHVREMASQAALATEQGPAVITVTPHGLLVGDDKRAKEPELSRTPVRPVRARARQVIFTPGLRRGSRRCSRSWRGIIRGGHPHRALASRLSTSGSPWRGHWSRPPCGRHHRGTLGAQYGHWRNLLVPDARASERRVQISPDDLRARREQRAPGGAARVLPSSQRTRRCCERGRSR